MTSCKEMAEQVTAFVEGAMPVWRRMGFWLHARLCPPCGDYLRQMKMTVGVLRSMPAATVPDEVKRELSQRYDGWQRSRDPHGATTHEEQEG